MSTLRCNSRRLLRLEAAAAECALGSRCGAAQAHSGHLRRERWYLRQPTHLARAQRGWDEDRPQPGGAADAEGRTTSPSSTNLSPCSGQPCVLLAVSNWARTQQVCRADQLWVADITYLKVLQHWCYLAVVMDRHTRRIVGWSLGPNKTTALTLRALNRAVANRQPSAGLVFHSDRGVEYAAYEFRTRLAALGIRQSMNRPGEPTDNAHMESFFHSLKSERLHGCAFATDAELRRAVRAYIAFYNQRRLHSALNYQSPVVYECAAA